MKHLVWIFVVLLLVLHHDFWFWDDARLVFGIFPMGLFYHICLSLAATCLWLFCVTFAWPKDLDEPDLDEGGNNFGNASSDRGKEAK